MRPIPQSHPKYGNVRSMTLTRWENPTWFLDRRETEIDDNLIEKRVRPIALGRKS